MDLIQCICVSALIVTVGLSIKSLFDIRAMCRRREEFYKETSHYIHEVMTQFDERLCKLEEQKEEQNNENRNQ